MNLPHPDRCAATLATRQQLLSTAGEGPFVVPGPGSDDSRVDLKLLLAKARGALATRGTDQARARIQALDSPDLWAGTIQDGTARGFKVALEEAISLCKPPAQEPQFDDLLGKDFDAKILRRKRDILVASGGSRIRFSRKGGILLVDRRFDFNEENCVIFEDRSDLGDLDGFEAKPGERPRLFSPGFLKATRLIQGPERDLLVLEGRLGRRFTGFPCQLILEGQKDESFVRMTVRVQNSHEDHRLRIRFLGKQHPNSIRHAGTPGWESVHHNGRTFVAATLVRACSGLQVGDAKIATPEAQCAGWIEHQFELDGSAPE